MYFFNLFRKIKYKFLSLFYGHLTHFLNLENGLDILIKIITTYKTLIYISIFNLSSY